MNVFTDEDLQTPVRTDEYTDEYSDEYVQKVVIDKIRSWANKEFENIKKEHTMGPYGIYRNQPYAFCSVGDEGEELCLYMFPGSIGSASKGGCAHDNSSYNSEGTLVETREVKFCSLDGTKECKKCKCKVPTFQPICFFCKDSTSGYTYINDSRCGISASAHIKYKKSLKEYIIFVSKYNREQTYIKLFAFKIMSNNEYFNTYITHQDTQSNSNTCNLLPFSFDFHMSGPIKLFEINLFGDHEDIIYFNLHNNQIEPIPYKNWNTGTTIFKKSKKELERVGLTESDFGETGLDYYENISKFTHRQKCFNKSRGQVSRG